MERTEQVVAISVDMRLTVLKPIVVRGMIEAVTFFDTADGKALILKGFEKAGVTRCFGRDFQNQAAAWVRQRGEAALNPAFEPLTSHPASAAEHSDTPIAVVFDDVEEEVIESGTI
jgi:hypothetical protein